MLDIAAARMRTAVQTLVLSGLPLGTSREYEESEVREFGFETLIGNFSTLRFHIKMTDAAHVSLVAAGTWLMVGGERRSHEYAGLVGMPQRMPDGRMLAICPEYSDGALHFELRISRLEA